ncbi:hypothetical protein PanWU01x14_041150, partial [Parasponia andersonii]
RKKEHSIEEIRTQSRKKASTRRNSSNNGVDDQQDEAPTAMESVKSEYGRASEL